MNSSDFEICPRARAVFHCDGDVLSIQYIVNDEPLGDARVYTRAEGVNLGQQLARDGFHEQFPISGVSTTDVQSFGVRLLEYGRSGK
jgi:hypothetical protein